LASELHTDVAASSAAQPAPMPNEIERRRELEQMKTRATGLLVLATVVFAVARTIWNPRSRKWRR